MMKTNYCYPILLNENEKETLNKWIKKLPKRYKDFPLNYVFETGGIGVSIRVRCGDTSIDITDYSTW